MCKCMGDVNMRCYFSWRHCGTVHTRCVCERVSVILFALVSDRVRCTFFLASCVPRSFAQMCTMWNRRNCPWRGRLVFNRSMEYVHTWIYHRTRSHVAIGEVHSHFECKPFGNCTHNLRAASSSQLKLNQCNTVEINRLLRMKMVFARPLYAKHCYWIAEMRIVPEQIYAWCEKQGTEQPFLSLLHFS